MVFNFTVRHDHAFKSCQTRLPLIDLRNLILIGQLRKQTEAFFHNLAAEKKLNTECYVIQSKICKLNFEQNILEYRGFGFFQI